MNSEKLQQGASESIFPYPLVAVRRQASAGYGMLHKTSVNGCAYGQDHHFLGTTREGNEIVIRAENSQNEKRQNRSRQH